MDVAGRRAALPRRRALLGAIAIAAALCSALAGPAAAGTPLVASSLASGDPTVSVRIRAPLEINVFRNAGFRYQDPDAAACTAASALAMLNFVSYEGSGGAGFRWRRTTSLASQTTILDWERRYDTLPGGRGSDPHGWRNALNYYGWGTGAMWDGKRIYEDVSYASYDGAMKSAVRALARTRKPVGLLAWRGAHAQVVTGYYGLSGNPFATNADGSYTNMFTVRGFYLSDSLRSNSIVNLKVGYETLRSTANLKLRFRTYAETDSTYDDPYTAGSRPSRDEWYGRFVLILPIR